MKTKILAVFLVFALAGEASSYAAPNFFKKKPSPKATQNSSEKQVAATVSGTSEGEEVGEPLTKEEQEEIFQEQKDLKDLKDSDRLAKEGANTASLNRSLSNRSSTPQAVKQAAGGGRAGAALAVVRAPERLAERPVSRPAAIVRPVGNPNRAVARAPERPAQNPNSQVARAPERPARR